MKKHLLSPMNIQLTTLAIIMVCSSCTSTTEPTFSQEYVVEAYLVAQQPFPSLRLSRTVPFGQAYRFDEQAVSDANVMIRQLNNNGGIDLENSYTEGSQAGIYIPSNSSIPVLPLKSYALEITFPDDMTVMRSVTLVPDTFRILRSTGDTVVFGSTEQLQIDVTASSYPGRQAVFVFSTESFDPTLDNLTPFFRDIFDEDTDDLEDFRINESPPINEGNYERQTDGSLTIKLPWIAVNFFGHNRITANAIDNNIFAFVTSQELQNNPSTLSPGEVPNVVDAIESGTGIFGSYSRVEKTITILRP